MLEAGERVTIEPGRYHAFWPQSREAIIGEVSMANDDFNDNFYVNPAIGRFPEIEEDEAPIVRLCWEAQKNGLCQRTCRLILASESPRLVIGWSIM